MLQISTMIWNFVKRDFLLTISYKTMFAAQLIGIFFSVAIFYYIGRVFEGGISSFLKPYQGNYFAFLLIGVAFTDYLSVSLGAFNRSIQENQMMGTMEILLLSPRRFSTILICSSLWPYLFTSLRFTLYLLFGITFFNLNIKNANILSAIVVMVLSIICLAAIGIIVASITLVFKKGVPLNILISAASVFLGGVAYPVEVLPGWMKQLSSYIPFTHSLTAMRSALLQGHGLKQLFPEITSLILFALIFTPIGLYSVHLAVRRTKVAGTLSHY
jgi:ABC-2 type transport system permease protein